VATVNSNVPPPPRLTGQTDTDLAAVTSWAYAMYRILTTDDGGLGTLKTDIAALKTAVLTLSTQTAASDAALAGAQDLLATSLDAVTVRLDDIAAITPVPGGFTTADLRLAINAIITAAA
jgi:hypothetical protein